MLPRTDYPRPRARRPFPLFSLGDRVGTTERQGATADRGGGRRHGPDPTRRRSPPETVRAPSHWVFCDGDARHRVPGAMGRVAHHGRGRDRRRESVTVLACTVGRTPDTRVLSWSSPPCTPLGSPRPRREDRTRRPSPFSWGRRVSVGESAESGGHRLHRGPSLPRNHVQGEGSRSGTDSDETPVPGPGVGRSASYRPRTDSRSLSWSEVTCRRRRYVAGSLVPGEGPLILSVGRGVGVWGSGNGPSIYSRPPGAGVTSPDDRTSCKSYLRRAQGRPSPTPIPGCPSPVQGRPGRPVLRQREWVPETSVTPLGSEHEVVLRWHWGGREVPGVSTHKGKIKGGRVGGRTPKKKGKKCDTGPTSLVSRKKKNQYLCNVRVQSFGPDLRPSTRGRVRLSGRPSCRVGLGQWASQGGSALGSRRLPPENRLPRTPSSPRPGCGGPRDSGVIRSRRTRDVRQTRVPSSASGTTPLLLSSWRRQYFEILCFPFHRISSLSAPVARSCSAVVRAGRALACRRGGPPRRRCLAPIPRRVESFSVVRAPAGPPVTLPQTKVAVFDLLPTGPAHAFRRGPPGVESPRRKGVPVETRWVTPSPQVQEPLEEE